MRNLAHSTPCRSIESDVDNLMRLITLANVLPKGLYVENAVKVGVVSELLVHWPI